MLRSFGLWGRTQCNAKWKMQNAIVRVPANETKTRAIFWFREKLRNKLSFCSGFLLHEFKIANNITKYYAGT